MFEIICVHIVMSEPSLKISFDIIFDLYNFLYSFM